MWTVFLCMKCFWYCFDIKSCLAFHLNIFKIAFVISLTFNIDVPCFLELEKYTHFSVWCLDGECLLFWMGIMEEISKQKSPAWSGQMWQSRFKFKFTKQKFMSYLVCEKEIVLLLLQTKNREVVFRPITVRVVLKHLFTWSTPYFLWSEWELPMGYQNQWSNPVLVLDLK